MAKRAQTIRRQIAEELFEWVWSFYEIGAKMVKGYLLGFSTISCL